MKKRIFALLTAALMLVAVFSVNVFAEEHVHASSGEIKEHGTSQHSYVCSCGETVIEDCVFESNVYNETSHWKECLYCHNLIEEKPHTMVNCECTHESCLYTDHDIDNWTPSEESARDHVGLCSKCNETVTAHHGYIMDYTEDIHWWVCVYCDLKEEGSEGEHSFGDFRYYSANHHHKVCNCGYALYEAHEDKNNDGICDVDTCAANDICIDDGLDHICDECEVSLQYLCTDNDGNHICDLEACKRYLIERCTDKNNDLLCDECTQNMCYHSLENITSNGDMTHTGVCFDCGETITEKCQKIQLNCDSEKHTWMCICDHTFESEKHSFDDNIIMLRSQAGHWILCDMCAFDKFEAHTDTEDECEACGLTLSGLFDIYVGGVGLSSGQYLDNSGRVSETKPDGGYAYYKDGVLELNGYVYEGNGFMWGEDLNVDESIKYYAPIFSKNDLVLMLLGDSSIANGDDLEEVDGVVTIGGLTVKGTGSLSVLATGDGIQVKNGDAVIESGTLTLGLITHNAYGSTNVNIEIGDDGFDLDGGSLEIRGGTVNINSDDNAMDILKNITISGGTLTIVADDDGIDSDGDIVISGGTVTVEADDNCIDSNAGSVTVSGGTVTLIADTYIGIEAEKNVTISDAKLDITSASDGIFAEEITVNGGELTVSAEFYTLYARSGKLNILSGTVSLTSTNAAVNVAPTLGKHILVSDGSGTLIEDPDFEEMDVINISTAPCENLSDWEFHDDTSHVRHCLDCQKPEYAAHAGGTATCKAKAICEDCSKEYGALGEHVENDGNGECDVCNTVIGAQSGEQPGETSGEQPDKKFSLGLIIGIIAGSAVIIGIAAFVIIRFLVKRKK